MHRSSVEAKSVSGSKSTNETALFNYLKQTPLTENTPRCFFFCFWFSAFPLINDNHCTAVTDLNQINKKKKKTAQTNYMSTQERKASTAAIVIRWMTEQSDKRKQMTASAAAQKAGRGHGAAPREARMKSSSSNIPTKNRWDWSASSWLMTAGFFRSYGFGRWCWSHRFHHISAAAVLPHLWTCSSWGTNT